MQTQASVYLSMTYPIDKIDYYKDKRNETPKPS